MAATSKALLLISRFRFSQYSLLPWVGVGEEIVRLRKSKPILLAGGAIWTLIAWSGNHYGLGLDAEQGARHSLVQYLELMLLLLVIMSYVNALTERRVFTALRRWLDQRQYGWRKPFWLTTTTPCCQR